MDTHWQCRQTHVYLHHNCWSMRVCYSTPNQHNRALDMPMYRWTTHTVPLQHTLLSLLQRILLTIEDEHVSPLHAQNRLDQSLLLANESNPPKLFACITPWNSNRLSPFFFELWPWLWNLSGWLWIWTHGTFLCLSFLDTSLRKSSAAGCLLSCAICRTCRTWFLRRLPNSGRNFGGIISNIIQENKAVHLRNAL